jgi:hypothetical protein
MAEVTPALRALSSAYVERRHKVASGSTLDSAGKRAAFALYYGPLHFLATAHVLARLQPSAPTGIIDLGCGTGVVGAAWALGLDVHPTPSLTGIDRHPWAVDETRHTYRDLGLSGQARPGDLTRLPSGGPGHGLAAAYVLNELADAARHRVVEHLLRSAAAGAHVLVMEPLARGIAPWWDEVARQFGALGGRADEWRFQPELPEFVAVLGKAAGLNVREIRVRTIFR